MDALFKKADAFLCDSKNIRAFLSLLLTIYILSPNSVYATGAEGALAPVYSFFLIVLASGVSVIVKIIVVKASFKKWSGFPFGTLIYIAIGEAMILSSNRPSHIGTNIRLPNLRSIWYPRLNV